MDRLVSLPAMGPQMKGMNMKKKFWLVLAAALALVAGAALPALADNQISGRVKLFSSLYLTDNLNGQYLTHKAGEFGLRRLELRFSLAGNVSDKVSYSLRADGFASPDSLSLADNAGLFPEASSLGTPQGSEPFELVLYEASVKVSDFLLKNLDLTVGKQRISWGTADKMNVVDNLNPVDLANFFSFDPDYFAERRPQTALNLEYYLSETTKLQLVWLLERQYSPLPKGFATLLAGAGMAGTVHLESQEPLLKNTSFGLRFSTALGKMDLGLSYYSGNFHLPVMLGLAWSPTGTDLGLYFGYPGQQVFGLDLAGEVAGVGLWAEAAYVVPERWQGFLKMPVIINGELMTINQTFPVFERGFTRFVLGADTTLAIGSGVYLNVQYLRGLFDESSHASLYRQTFLVQKGMFFGELEDYVMGRAEYKFLRGDLKLELSSLLELADGKSAWVFMPGLEYRVSDALALQAGTFWAAGNETGTKFGQFKKDRLAYFAFKVSF